MSPNRHGLERVVKMRAASAAYLVRMPSEGEDPAQLRMVTPEGEV